MKKIFSADDAITEFVVQRIILSTFKFVCRHQTVATLEFGHNNIHAIRCRPDAGVDSCKLSQLHKVFRAIIREFQLYDCANTHDRLIRQLHCGSLDGHRFN